MNYNLELPKFLDVLYLPEHENIPGYLNLTCTLEKVPGWEVERGFTFQYLHGKVFFRVYPTLVQLLLGEASNVEEAVELAKEFLSRWLGHDVKDSRFRSETAEEIARLEEAKRKEQEQESGKNYEQNLRLLTKTLEELWKNKKK